MLEPAQSSSTPPEESGDDEAVSGGRRSRLENPETVKALTILVIVLGIILVLGFVTVIGRIVYLVTRPAPQEIEQIADPSRPVVPLGGGLSDGAATAKSPDLPPAGPVALGLPPGARIEAMTLDGNRLAISVALPGLENPAAAPKRRVIVIDIRTGQTIATLDLGGATTPP